MRTKAFLLIAACLLPVIACRADDSRHATALRAEASTDSTEVHPDNIFDVTLTLQNLTDTVQKIRIPDCGWDRVWRSSNRHVTWDAWDCDSDDLVTIEIAPHDSYVFSKTLRMFVDDSAKKARIDFKMGFKETTFGKTIWSNPITLELIQ